MAGFSPQGVAVTGGGVRRKQKSPYLDLIRGQYGQATENVLAQRQEDQRQQETQANQNFQQQQLGLQYKNQKFQEKQAKQAGLMSAIGTGINAVGTLGNLYNNIGGMTGIKKIGDSIGGLFSSFGGLFK